MDGRVSTATSHLDGLFVLTEYTENLELALGSILLGSELAYQDEARRLYRAVENICYLFKLSPEILKKKAQSELEQENERAKLPQLDEWSF